MAYIPLQSSVSLIQNSNGTTKFSTSLQIVAPALTANRLITITSSSDANCTLTLSSTGIDSTPIGATSPSTGAFTTFSTSSTSTLTGNVGVGGGPLGTSGLYITSAVSGNGAGAIYSNPIATATGNSQGFYLNFLYGTYATTNNGYTGLAGVNLYVTTPIVSGSSGLSASYQIYIGAASTATTRYGIYQAGTDVNYFGGNIGIGSAGLPNVGLYVINTYSGGNSYGIYSAPQITATGNSQTLSNVGVAAAGFFFGSFTGCAAANLIIATPTITGTPALSYQIYINAAGAGTNKYGIYQVGTDPNFLGGALAVTGLTTSTNGFGGITGGSFAQGSYYYSSTLGLVIGAKTGSVFDFALYNPAGATQIIGLETGTTNLVLVGTGRFTSAGLAVTGVLTTTDNVTITKAAGTLNMISSSGRCLFLNRSNGTAGSNTDTPVFQFNRNTNAMPSGALAGEIRFDGLTSASTYTLYGMIQVGTTGATTSTGSPSRMDFIMGDGTTNQTPVQIFPTGMTITGAQSTNNGATSLVATFQGSVSNYILVTDGVRQAYLQAVTSGAVRVGSLSNHSMELMINSGVQATLSSTGLAITGTLTTTSNAAIGTSSSTSSNLIINHTLPPSIAQAAVVVSGTFTAPASTGLFPNCFRAITDYTAVLAADAFTAYDTNTTLRGTVALNHYYGYQARHAYSGSNTLDVMAGFMMAAGISSGTVTEFRAFYVPTQSVSGGTVVHFAGLYMDSLGTFATTTDAIYCAGADRWFSAGGQIITSALLAAPAGATTARGIFTFNQTSQTGVAIMNSNATATGTMVSFCNNGGTVQGSITQTNSTTVAYNTSSDIRLKTNIRDLISSGEIIDALHPVIFDWKWGGKDSFGFIAQEIAEVFPEAVVVGDDDPLNIRKTWMMDASKLIPVLTAEIKSLRSRVTELEAQRS